MITPYILQAGGFDSETRMMVYGIPTKTGIFVSCDNWNGTLNEFKQRINAVYKGKPYYDEYMAVVKLFNAAYKRIKKEQSIHNKIGLRQ